MQRVFRMGELLVVAHGAPTSCSNVGYGRFIADLHVTAGAARPRAMRNASCDGSCDAIGALLRTSVGRGTHTRGRTLVLLWRGASTCWCDRSLAEHWDCRGTISTGRTRNAIGPPDASSIATATDSRNPPRGERTSCQSRQNLLERLQESSSQDQYPGTRHSVQQRIRYMTFQSLSRTSESRFPPSAVPSPPRHRRRGASKW